MQLQFRPLKVNIGAERRIRCVAWCWVPFPNDAAYALAHYGHSCRTLLGFFFYFLLFILFVRICVKKMKPCNLFTGVLQILTGINGGDKGLIGGGAF